MNATIANTPSLRPLPAATFQNGFAHAPASGATEQPLHPMNLTAAARPTPLNNLSAESLQSLRLAAGIASPSIGSPRAAHMGAMRKIPMVRFGSEPLNSKIKAVFVASSMDPLFSDGGLSSVTQSIPLQSVAHGVQMSVVIPFMKDIEAVEELLPLSGDKLVEAIKKRYGADEKTVKAKLAWVDEVRTAFPKGFEKVKGPDGNFTVPNPFMHNQYLDKLEIEVHKGIAVDKEGHEVTVYALKDPYLAQLAKLIITAYTYPRHRDANGKWFVGQPSDKVHYRPATSKEVAALSFVEDLETAANRRKIEKRDNDGNYVVKEWDRHRNRYEEKQLTRFEVAEPTPFDQLTVEDREQLITEALQENDKNATIGKLTQPSFANENDYAYPRLNDKDIQTWYAYNPEQDKIFVWRPVDEAVKFAQWTKGLSETLNTDYSWQTLLKEFKDRSLPLNEENRKRADLWIDQNAARHGFSSISWQPNHSNSSNPFDRIDWYVQSAEEAPPKKVDGDELKLLFTSISARFYSDNSFASQNYSTEPSTFYSSGVENASEFVTNFAKNRYERALPHTHHAIEWARQHNLINHTELITARPEGPPDANGKHQLAWYIRKDKNAPEQKVEGNDLKLLQDFLYAQKVEPDQGIPSTFPDGYKITHPAIQIALMYNQTAAEFIRQLKANADAHPAGAPTDKPAMDVNTIITNDWLSASTLLALRQKLNTHYKNGEDVFKNIEKVQFIHNKYDEGLIYPQANDEQYLKQTLPGEPKPNYQRDVVEANKAVARFAQALGMSVEDFFRYTDLVPPAKLSAVKDPKFTLGADKDISLHGFGLQLADRAIVDPNFAQSLLSKEIKMDFATNYQALKAKADAKRLHDMHHALLYEKFSPTDSVHLDPAKAEATAAKNLGYRQLKKQVSPSLAHRLGGATNSLINLITFWRPDYTKRVTNAQQLAEMAEWKAFKADNKKALQKEFGLKEDPNAVIYTFVARWDIHQKGTGMILDTLVDFAETHPHAQFIMRGMRDESPFGESWAKQVEEAIQKNSELKERCSVVPEYVARDTTVRLKAGSDYVLHPSIYEPYGLVQQESMALGELPIVTHHDGFIATVSDPESGLESQAAKGFADRQTGIFLKNFDRAAYINALNYMTNTEKSGFTSIENADLSGTEFEAGREQANAAFVDALERAYEMGHPGFLARLFGSDRMNKARYNANQFIQQAMNSDAVYDRYYKPMYDAIEQSLATKTPQKLSANA